MNNRRWDRQVALGIAIAMLLAGCSQVGADWKQASAANTIEAYQGFLQQHPRGAEATQAQVRIQQLSEQRDWQIASATDTSDAYQQFLTRHPDSHWAQESRIRIENFAQGGGGAGGPPAAKTTAATSPAVAPSAGVEPSVGASAGVAPSTGAARAQRPVALRISPVHPASSKLLARRAHTETVARPGSLVQLGAFRTRAGAVSEWRVLAARFSTLRSLTPRYIAVKSRGGRLYRLQVRVSTPAAADGLCATLKRHARSCVRVNA